MGRRGSCHLTWARASVTHTHNISTSSSIYTSKSTSSIFSTWVLLVLLIVSCTNTPVIAIQWLALSRVTALAVTSPGPRQCDAFYGSLVKQQVRFCKDNPDFMNSVKRGAIWAIDECQFQFRTRRWNCSTLDDEAIAAFKKALKPKNTPDVVMASNKTERAVPITAPPKMKKRSRAFKSAALSSSKSSSSSSSSLSSSSSSLLSSSSLASSSSTSNHLDPQDNSTPSRRKYKKRKRRTRNRKNLASAKKKSKAGLIGPYPIVPQGTREAAFVHAISSAGVAHAITRRCSTGELDDCGCDRSVRGVTSHGFRWSGCSDNIAYGVSLSKRFVDARDRKLVQRHKRKGKPVSPRALMNLHNNEAGRQLIESNMRVECKCHGVSGSCELRTCWKAMPTFREIGEILKDKFDGATEVRVKTVAGRPELEPNQQYFKKPSELDLVYVQSSPEYCEYDINSGSLGTHGRRCNEGSRGLDGCDLLCCNRGYTSFQERVKERCSCKFHWCCFVKCRTCVRDVTVHVCN